MTETARIDKVTGEFERKGLCEACGLKVTRTKTLSAPSYELMLAAGEAWGEQPLTHKVCEGRAMRPSKWVTPSGKVHRRRLRFWVGTAHETKANPDVVTTLCGTRQPLKPAVDGATVDCGVCIKASSTGAHLRGRS